MGWFNPLNWKRNDPLTVSVSDLATLKGAGVGVSQAMPDGSLICQMELPPAGFEKIAAAGQGVTTARATPLPNKIDTRYYIARVDAKTGALLSLKLKPGGREMLGGSGNVIVAERPTKQNSDPGDHMHPRPQRLRLSSSMVFLKTGTFHCI